MTIKDIARESGFAIGTVSRALNNAPGVSAETRQKILEVVNRHNYEPNANAKHLKQQANDGIALIVKGTQNMLFADILEQLQGVIEESGYVATVYYIDEEANEVAQARRICAERKPYGILFLGSNLEYFTPDLEDLGIPCLLLTNSAATLRIANLSSVSVDDMAASDRMIEYLYKQGHRRIGIIGGKPNLSRPSLARLAGCQSAMLRLGLPSEMEKQYAYARFSLRSGYEAMEYLLDHSPDITTVFAMSDLMALGAIRALQDHGLRVPQDISVAGYDGIALGQYSIPRLTTIRQDMEQLAQRSAKILLHCIEEPGRAVHEVVPFDLIEGEAWARFDDFAKTAPPCRGRTCAAHGLAVGARLPEGLRAGHTRPLWCLLQGAMPGIALAAASLQGAASPAPTRVYIQRKRFSLMRASGILMPISSLPSAHGIGAYGCGGTPICGVPLQGRAGILADLTHLPHQLRRQPLSVLLDVCGQPVFYRPRRACQTRPASARGI